MASPFPFTAGQVLTAAQLNSIGDYTDYSATASFNNFTLGNGTARLFYTQVNDLVHYLGSVTFGSTTSITGSLSVSLPVSPHLFGGYLPGVAMYIDGGATLYSGVCTLASGAGTLAFRVPKITATYTRVDSVGTTVPMTWTTSDELFFNITYKAA